MINPGKWDKAIVYVRKHKLAAILTAIGLVVLIAGAVIFFQVEKEKQYYGEYYITASGNKYHEKDCIYVKDKTNTHRMTIGEYESGEYEPCRICLP